MYEGDGIPHSQDARHVHRSQCLALVAPWLISRSVYFSLLGKCGASVLPQVWRFAGCPGKGSHFSGQHDYDWQMQPVALARRVTARRCAKVLAGDVPRVSLGSACELYLFKPFRQLQRSDQTPVTRKYEEGGFNSAPTH